MSMHSPRTGGACLRSSLFAQLLRTPSLRSSARPHSARGPLKRDRPLTWYYRFLMYADLRTLDTLPKKYRRIGPGLWGNRKAGPPRRGERQARLDTEIVTLRPIFVYDANGRFLRGGMCFDTGLEGNGGPSGRVPPCPKVSAACPCGIGPGLCSISCVDFREDLLGEVRE
jgi:hypothetical protein